MVCSDRLSRKRRSQRETESEEGVKLHAIDPKPGDLSMARVKQV
jgi:hypothetical protein